MASPSSRSVSSSTPTPLRLPPTGPKALRGINGTPPSGPSGLSPRDKISFAIPIQPKANQVPPVGLNKSTSLGSSFGKPGIPTPPTGPANHRHINGFSTASVGESSKHALQMQLQQRVNISNGHSAKVVLPARPSSFPSSSSSTNHHTASDDGPSRRSSSSRHGEHEEQRSPSPSKRSRDKLKKSKPVDDSAGGDFRKQFLPVDDSVRTPISIAIPGFPNGTPRPRPPHLDILLASKSAGKPTISIFDRRKTPPPAPPDHRPPTPPPPDEGPLPPPPDDRPPTPPVERPTTPPPPLDFVPLPPPSPPTDSPPLWPSSLPSPSSAAHSRPHTPIIASVPQAPPSPILPKATPISTPLPAPPSFHFRELPLRPKSPSPDDESETSSTGNSVVEEEVELQNEVSMKPSETSRSPTPPPYIAPAYVAPPSTARRPGLGNFLVLHDPAVHGSKGGKEVIRRYDGQQGDVEIKVDDPRLHTSEEVRRRGRGSAKQRTSFQEVEYEWWDEYSTGPKPPPPPSAILIAGLNPLTTVDQITKFVRPYGRIREIDPKMDLKSGMQLGICWVKFDGPLPGRPGTGHDVANQVVKACDGQRVGLAGDERVKVVLDGRGLRTEKAVKEEMVRRYPPKKVEPPKPMAAPAIKTPSSGAATPRPDSVNKPVPSMPRPLPSSLPARPRPPITFNTAERNISSLARSIPARSFAPPAHPSLPSRPVTGVQQLNSSFVDAPFAPRAHTAHHKRHDDARDSYSLHYSRSRSRSYSRCSTCSSSSESEDDRPAYRRRSRSPYDGPRGRGRGPALQPNKEDDEAVERMKKALALNGHACAFIDATCLPQKSVSEEDLKDHFRAFKPSDVLCNPQGWHILFNDDTTAQRAKLLDNTIVQGHRLIINVKTPPSAQKAPENGIPIAATTETKVEKGWRFLTITKKNRPAVKPKLTPKTEAPPRRRSFSSSSSSSEDESKSSLRQSRKTSISSASELSEDDTVVAPPKRKRLTETPASVDDASTMVPPVDEPMPMSEGEPELDEIIKPPRKRVAKPKVAKGAKKARIESPVLEVEVPLLPPVIPEVAEIKLDSPKKGVKAVKLPKPKKAPQDPVDKLIESGDIEDEEDAYWLGQALEAACEGFEPDFSDDGEVLLDEKHPLYHKAGAWRAEGWKKVPQIQKSSYLPQRNRAAVSVEDAGALTTGRTARVTGRRLALDMETHRKTAASATDASDLFAFNQLRIRKKQLRFARSAIEGYGLYAMETIQAGEMVCEYVGEICRSAVAEIREQRYLKQGIGSSYLFRIDADAVCDATFRGSVSRLINHSCDPSANAKIISINGHAKIVIYAKRTLHPGEEILYDYKFPLESDPALRVPCLCGAATCRGWLN